MTAASDTVTATEAHAKINLRHRVFRPDEAGYHGVETILVRTSLTDTLRLEATSGGIELEVDGPQAEGIPTGSENLCWRAAERFLERAFPRRSARPGVRFTLTKRIPSGSGLGGGSADAAAALRLLAERWGRLNARDLVTLSGELGSDITFALIECPMALGWERGRRLLPLRSPPPRPALLLIPPMHVSTPEAYAWLDEKRASDASAGQGVTGRRDDFGRSSDALGAPDPGGASVLPGSARLGEWDALARLVRNDLEAPVFAHRPELSAALERIDGEVAITTGMTGSGSTLFGIFPDGESRSSVRERLLRDGCDAAEWEQIEVRLPV